MDVITLFECEQLKIKAENADEAFMLGFAAGELKSKGYEIQPNCPTISRDTANPSLVVYLAKKPQGAKING